MARLVTFYRTRYMPEDVHDGDIPRDDTDEDIVTCEPDRWDREDGLTPIDLAVKALVEEESCVSPSTMPGFHTGLWYSHIDGSAELNPYTGEREERSGHLSGFTEDEEREIHKRVMDAYAGIFGAQYRVA